MTIEIKTGKPGDGMKLEAIRPANGKARRYLVRLSDLHELGTLKFGSECIQVVPVADYDHLLREFYELQRQLNRKPGESD